jgi:hypothetical protein
MNPNLPHCQPVILEGLSPATYSVVYDLRVEPSG